MTDRLILKPQPLHHRQRFVALVGLGTLVVLGVWGVQLKLMFAKSAAVRNSVAEIELAVPSVSGAETIDPAVKEQSVAALQNLIKQIVDQTTAAEPIVTPVPTPEVAGETIEN